MITILSPDSHYDFLSLMPSATQLRRLFRTKVAAKSPGLSKPKFWSTPGCDHHWGVIELLVLLFAWCLKGVFPKKSVFFYSTLEKKPAMTWLVQENKTWRWDFTRSSWSFRVRFAATHGIHPSFNSKFLITTNWLPWVHPKTSTVCSSSPS